MRQDRAGTFDPAFPESLTPKHTTKPHPTQQRTHVPLLVPLRSSFGHCNRAQHSTDGCPVVHRVPSQPIPSTNICSHRVFQGSRSTRAEPRFPHVTATSRTSSPPRVSVHLIWAAVSRPLTRTHTCTHTLERTHTRGRTHAHAHAHTNTRTHIRTHACTP